MRAGELDRRISIQRRVTSQDGYGGPTAAWTEVAKAWARIRDMSGRQYIAAQGERNQVQTEITIRYRDDIEAAMRVLHGSDVYDIEAVLGQDRRWLMLMCVRGVSDG